MICGSRNSLTGRPSAFRIAWRDARAEVRSLWCSLPVAVRSLAPATIHGGPPQGRPARLTVAFGYYCCNMSVSRRRFLETAAASGLAASGALGAEDGAM